MALHPYEIAEIKNLMDIIEDVFPENTRSIDFPDNLEMLELAFVFDHGVVFLDEDNRFAYMAITDADTTTASVMMNMAHRDVIETENPALIHIIEKVKLIVSRLDDNHGVRFIKADLGYSETTFIERIIEMTSARNWPTN